MVATEHTLTRDETNVHEIPPHDGWIRFDPGAAAHAGTDGPLAYGPHVPDGRAEPEPHIIRSVN
ncbi:hypothetical protein [Streptomyces sp. 184]|uniref:hypothetical protein n=1 Tax=Streptomyces sp. 184 TaxID=1827526 RepID=UPI003892043F